MILKEQLKNKIEEDYGLEYYNNRKCKKVKGAQEAHEAIRPTDINLELNKKYDEVDIKLYNLIKKKTILSHMKPALYDVLQFNITNKKIEKYGIYNSKIKSLKFDGYLKYNNTEKDIIDLEIYNKLNNTVLEDAIFKSKECEPPNLYNESSVVKKLENSGVGRPSTYATLIETLYNRTYTEQKTIKEFKKKSHIIQLLKDNQH